MGIEKIRRRLHMPAQSIGSTNVQVKHANKRVNNTQMLALLGTDVTLVAAPGAGKTIIVDQAYLYFDSAGAYTLGTAALAIGYGSDNADIAAITDAAFLDQATDQARVYGPTLPLTPTSNVPVVLRATVADLTGGNAANTVSIFISYRVVPAAAFV